MSVPETVGRFRVRKEIGRGAMGVVYLAEDPVLGRQVAIKSIQVHPGLDDHAVAELRQRFENEARSAANLSHPNLVTIFDAGLENDALYIAMEFVQGEALDDIIASDRLLTYKDISDLILQLGGALDHAHSQGIVHRDIKPANILINRAGQPKVTDFGVARQATSTLTATGTIIGTPAYMSPEQITGHPVTGRSDQFSLGIVVYELLTRRKPFVGEGATTILYKIVHEDPETPNSITRNLPEGIDAVVLRAMAKDSEDRFPTCLDFARAVRDVLGAAPADDTVALSTAGRRPVPGAAEARTHVSPPPAAAPTDTVPSAAQPAPPTATAAVERKPLIYGAVAAGVALVLLLGWALSGGSDPALEPLPVPETDGLQASELAGAAPPESAQVLAPNASDIDIDAALAEPAAVSSGPMTLRVISRPAGATVRLDGEALEGVTPLEITVPSDQQHTVVLEYAGHQSLSWAFVPARLSEAQRASGELFFPLAAVVAPAPAAVSSAGDTGEADDASSAASASPESPATVAPPEDLPPVDPQRTRGNDVVAPAVITQVEPEMPDWAVEQGLPTFVILELVIDREGRVRDAKVLRAVHPTLEQLALDAARLWTFEPATRRGEAIDVYHNVAIRFREPDGS